MFVIVTFQIVLKFKSYEQFFQSTIATVHAWVSDCVTIPTSLM